MNKKEIRIDLLPEDFKNTQFTDCGDCAAARAIKRYFMVDYVSISVHDASTWNAHQESRNDFEIKNAFNTEDYNFVKSQYEKGTKTRYYITLIPQ